MKPIFRKSTCLAILILFPLLVFSQEKKREFSINLGVGSGSMEGYYNGYNKHSVDVSVLYLGCNMRYYINSNWALTPEIGFLLHDDLNDHSGHSSGYVMNNEESDNSSYVHIPIRLQYIIKPWEKRNHRLMFSAGPALDITLYSEKYKYYKGDWSAFEESGSYYDKRRHSLEGRRKFRPFGFGFQLGVTYSFGHFQIGIEDHINITNMRKKYEVDTGKLRYNEAWCMLSYCF